jgi:hypothetical protein
VWTRTDWIALSALALATWSVAAIWRRRRDANAVRAAGVLEFALAAARYSWTAERRFSESWRLMPDGSRPQLMEPPPVPEDAARTQLVELCRVRSALAEVHRLFNLYASAPRDDGTEGRFQPEWWRDRFEKPIHGACGAVRSAIADSACRRFTRFSVTARQLQAVLVKAQTSRH